MRRATRTMAIAVVVGLTAPEIGGQASSAGPFSPVTYNIIDLGTLGGSSSTALAINNNGQVVGSADTPQGQRHAYLWENGQMIDLGTLGSPSAQSEAWDINNLGVVVGIVGGGDPSASFIWENGVQSIIGPPQVLKSALGINDARQVVGVYIAPPVGDQRAFLWENGTMTDLGTLGGTNSIAWDINEAGQVVGSSYTGGFTEHAFLWQAGIMTDLGTLGGSHSEGFDLNDLGKVVGWAQRDPGSKYYHAFLWNDGQMTDLGALGGLSSSSAQAINNHGVVIGWGSWVYAPQEGMLRNLEDMISPDSGWSDLVPRDINDNGWIVGYGSFSGAGGAHHSFAMIPTPEIPAVSKTGTAVMGLLLLPLAILLIAIRRRGAANG